MVRAGERLTLCLFVFSYVGSSSRLRCFFCFFSCGMCCTAGYCTPGRSKPICIVCHARRGTDARSYVQSLSHSSTLIKQLPPQPELRMQLPRIHHPRLNRLIFSRQGLWESTCFISVLLALPEAPQLFGALRVCRVIFLKHTSNTWMNGKVVGFMKVRRSSQTHSSWPWTSLVLLLIL